MSDSEFWNENADKPLSELTKEERDKLISELTDKLMPPGPEKGRYEQMTLPEHKALGLKAVLAYHCLRCQYLWFPRDYEIDFFALNIWISIILENERIIVDY